MNHSIENIEYQDIFTYEIISTSCDSWHQFKSFYKDLVIFTRNLCSLLGLSSINYYHSVTLLQKYLFIISQKVKSKQFDFKNGIHYYYLIAMSCTLVSIKVNYSPMLPLKVRDVLNVGYHLLSNENLLLNDDYYTIKENVIKVEQHLLRILEFDVGLPKKMNQLPHPYLLNFLYFLESNQVESQVSYNILNDSILNLSIYCRKQEDTRFGYEEIAIFSLLYAFEMCEITIPIEINDLYLLLGFENTKNTNTKYNDFKFHMDLFYQTYDPDKEVTFRPEISIEICKPISLVEDKDIKDSQSNK
ncbi:hypothetical protein CYY_006186 [Polysphondylium violaceum]|uniref:Cyclin N-terminal domain-containing protein n=1 Tax=Polysphondylium violaceum TaxID=133409 RepID=A0A8J4PTY0_9MYCE|nr:hypothetical protein CYY_006186 [Polysphondylium violaceum]